MKTIIIKSRRIEQLEQLKTFKLRVSNHTTDDQIKKDPLIKPYLTPTLKKKKVTSLDEFRNLVITRYKKLKAIELKELEDKLESIKQAKPIKSISISVDWSLSRTWGMNPKAEIRVDYKDSTCEHFESRRVSGCGYCKLSTAIAEAANQSPAILKLLEKLRKVKDRPYGVRIPTNDHARLSVGVGVNSFKRVFEALGYRMECVVSNKVMDVYTIKYGLGKK